MIPTELIWLLKLLVAHMLTDFVLQPKSWILERNLRHFASPKLYLHGLFTAAAAFAMVGPMYWKIAAVIFITHTVTDGWKSYRRQTLTIFIIDQLLHLMVIGLCWYFSFFDRSRLMEIVVQVKGNTNFWATITAIVFLTSPAGILIGQMTMKWREKINGAESLANAGKWIGIIERLIVFILVMLAQYAAISLLIAAKGIIRFNEKDRPEVKTEYLVIGTLLSIGIAMITGILLKALPFY